MSFERESSDLTWPEFKNPSVAIWGAIDLISTDLQIIAASFPPLQFVNAFIISGFYECLQFKSNSL
jgi:hypothetical protein